MAHGVAHGDAALGLSGGLHSDSESEFTIERLLADNDRSTETALRDFSQAAREPTDEELRLLRDPLECLVTLAARPGGLLRLLRSLASNAARSNSASLARLVLGDCATAGNSADLMRELAMTGIRARIAEWREQTNQHTPAPSRARRKGKQQ